MHASLRGAVVLLQVMALGCANLSSVHRPLDINKGKGVLIDIKQRAILVRANPLRVCAEPSPDALAAYAAEISGKLDTAGKTSLALGLSNQEAASFVGLRTASIQLLRDSLYRVCEMYLNGAIDDLQYQILVRRYQKYTVALLAIEQLTGAVRAQASPPLTPGATPSPTPKPTSTPKASSSPNPTPPVPAATPTPPTPTPTTTPAAVVAAPRSDVSEGWAQSPVVFAARTKTPTPTPSPAPSGSSSAPSATPVPATTPEVTPAAATGGSVAAVAGVVREIVMRILDTDDETQLCVAYLRKGDLEEPLLGLCTDYVKRRNEAYLKSLECSCTPSVGTSTPPPAGKDRPGPPPMPPLPPPPPAPFAPTPTPAPHI